MGKLAKNKSFFIFLKLKTGLLYTLEEPLVGGTFPQPFDAYIRHCNA